MPSAFLRQTRHTKLAIIVRVDLEFGFDGKPRTQPGASQCVAKLARTEVKLDVSHLCIDEADREVIGELASPRHPVWAQAQLVSLTLVP